MNVEVVLIVLGMMACLWAGFAQTGCARPQGESLEERAKRVHAEAIVIDTHSDTTLKMRKPEWEFMERHEDGHMDYPRIREGGLDAVFLAVYLGEQKPEEPGIAVKKAMKQFDWILSLPEQHPDLILVRLLGVGITEKGQGGTVNSRCRLDNVRQVVLLGLVVVVLQVLAAVLLVLPQVEIAPVANTL